MDLSYLHELIFNNLFKYSLQSDLSNLDTVVFVSPYNWSQMLSRIKIISLSFESRMSRTYSSSFSLGVEQDNQ